MSTPDAPEKWPLGRLLSTAARQVEHEWNAWLAQHGLTHAGLLALHTLRAGPMSQRSLAHACRVEEQTMSRIVERLERTGHVTRTRDDRDRRRLLIERTPEGAAVANRAVRSGVADRLVSDRVSNPATFRAELIRLVSTVSKESPR